MYKLLTETARENVEKEYKQRRLVILMLGVCIILVAGIVALMPSYVISKTRLTEANSRTEVLKLLPSSQDGFALEKWLADVNLKISIFSKNTDENKPYELFLKILSVKPNGISLGQFEWKVDGLSMNVSVSGIARDRKALLDFESGLNNTKWFSKAVVPVSNFAKDKDIDFDLTVSPLKGIPPTN